MPRRKVIPDGTPITYSEFRTGLTFREARNMLWKATDDTTEWRQKRRGSVLGLMREMKQEMWAEFCARNPELVRE